MPNRDDGPVASGTDGTGDPGRRVQVEQVHYDREGDAELAAVIVSAVADAKGVNPLDYTEMPPLYESVDAEMLEGTLFGHAEAGNDPEGTSEVRFEYEGYEVVVRSDGWILVTERR